MGYSHHCLKNPTFLFVKHILIRVGLLINIDYHVPKLPILTPLLTLGL